MTHSHSFIDRHISPSIFVFEHSLSPEKIFRRSLHEIWQCWKLSGYYFFLEVPVIPHSEPCYFIRSNNYLALGIKSLRHRVERAIFKNPPLIAE